jgi:hypothetical protein
MARAPPGGLAALHPGGRRVVEGRHPDAYDRIPGHGRAAADCSAPRAGVLDYRNDRHVDRLVEGNCSLVWLDQARDLPEEAFDQAHAAVARYWPSGLERKGPPLKRIIVTSRMPLADHWIARRFAKAAPNTRCSASPAAAAPTPRPTICASGRTTTATRRSAWAPIGCAPISTPNTASAPPRPPRCAQLRAEVDRPARPPRRANALRLAQLSSSDDRPQAVIGFDAWQAELPSSIPRAGRKRRAGQLAGAAQPRRPAALRRAAAGAAGARAALGGEISEADGFALPAGAARQGPGAPRRQRYRRAGV